MYLSWWPARARIAITGPPEARCVRVVGLLWKHEQRIARFVEAEHMPAGTVTLTMRWRYKFKGFSGGQEQQFRNFLAAECNVLPAGHRPGKRTRR